LKEFLTLNDAQCAPSLSIRILVLVHGCLALEIDQSSILHNRQPAIPTLRISPRIHIPHSTRRKVRDIPLVQTGNEISLWSLGCESSNIEEAGLLVVSWSTVCANRVLEDLLAGAGSTEFWGGSEMADDGDFGEGGAGGGGRKCTSGVGWESAAEEEGRHFGMDWVGV